MDISNRAKKVESGTRGPIYREAMRLTEEGENIIKLNTGNPAAFGFEMPESLKIAITQALSKAAAYTDTSGIDSAKNAILEYDLSKGFKNISTKDIFIGNGVSELAELTCSVILDKDDEILLPSPNYNLWTNSSILADATPVFYNCIEEDGWQPDVKDIESKVSDKTKAIVVINPHNPTGALYSDENLTAIADVARRHHLVILADEIYDRIVMDGCHHSSMAALAPDIPVAVYNGLSKSHVICGIRCGWVSFSGFNSEYEKAIKQSFEKLCAVRLCPNSIAQYCIPAALADPEYTNQMVGKGGRIYEQRNACVEAIEKSECLSTVKNKGALYCFVRIDPDKCPIYDDKQFALDLLKEKHILIVTASGFDYPKPNYFRIVMLPKPDDLKEAIERIDDFCKHYKQNKK